MQSDPRDPSVPREPIRVAHLMWRIARTGGIQMVVRRLIADLDPSRVRITIVSARVALPDDEVEQLDADWTTLGLTVEGRHRLWRPQLAWRAARELARLRPDVVHLHSGTAWMGVLARLRLPRTPFVLEVHDAPGSERHSGSSDRVEQLLLRFGKVATVCHSSSVARDVATRWGVPADTITRFPLGVDTSTFRPGADASQRRTWRSEHRIPADAFVVIGVGRFATIKRFDLAIESVADQVAHGIDAHLVLVGRGPDRDRLLDIAAGLGVADRLHLPHAPDDAGLVAALRAADVLISTSTYEGFGLTLAEAMATGLPVVATAVGGVTDVVADGVTGHLVAAEDSVQLRARLLELATDPTGRSAMGVAARERAVSTFDTAVVADSFGRLYERLRDGGSPRPRT